MSVDVWFTQDIRQVILAAVRANEEALAAGLVDRDPPHERAYHQGFKAALSTLALALGLPMLPPIDDEERCTVVESPMAIDTGPCLFVQAEDGGHTHELIPSGVPVEVSRGHGPAVV
ncbi:MAG: hypothetical protein WCD51_01015 [Anaerolineae bacterium]